MAELAEKRPVVAEIYPQSSRNREYPLPVRDIGKHFTIEAMSKQQGSLLSATGTTTTSPARKGNAITLHVWYLSCNNW
jgi:hypothetical protein